MRIFWSRDWKLREIFGSGTEKWEGIMSGNNLKNWSLILNFCTQIKVHSKIKCHRYHGIQNYIFNLDVHKNSSVIIHKFMNNSKQIIICFDFFINITHTFYHLSFIGSNLIKGWLQISWYFSCFLFKPIYPFRKLSFIRIFVYIFFYNFRNKGKFLYHTVFEYS